MRYQFFKHYCPALILVLSVSVGVQGRQVPAAPEPSNPQSSMPPKPTIAVNPRPPVQKAVPDISDVNRFRLSRLPNQILSATIDTDHENAGLMTEKGGPYTGIYAIHPVFQTGTAQLKLPASATRDQILYAATTRPPNGSCLEVGTAYITDRNTNQTKVSLYVYNFCAPGGGDWGIPPVRMAGKKDPIAVDDKFIQSYGRAPTKNFQSRAYAVTIYTSDSEISAKSNWYAQIFNFTTNKYDPIYSARGAFLDDERGWSIFETYYQNGLCSELLPTLGAEGFSLFNSATHMWEPISDKVPNLPVKVTRGGEHNNNCFIADQTGPASYLLGPDPPSYSWWRVLSR